jgi:hypothetical protein
VQRIAAPPSSQIRPRSAFATAAAALPQLNTHKPQLATASIRAEIFIVEKFEKVSDIA